MTTNEWRSKHPRCRFCKHKYDYRTLLGERHNWCKTKDKRIRLDMQAMFCGLYELRKEI